MCAMSCLCHCLSLQVFYVLKALISVSASTVVLQWAVEIQQQPEHWPASLAGTLAFGNVRACLKHLNNPGCGGTLALVDMGCRKGMKMSNFCRKSPWSPYVFRPATYAIMRPSRWACHRVYKCTACLSAQHDQTVKTKENQAIR
jgi:hypothetical protein